MLKSSLEFIKKLIGCFKPEDIEVLNENAELIAGAMKNFLNCMTPKFLSTANTTFETYCDFEPEIPEKISLFKMLGLIKSQEIKTILYVGVEFLRNWMNNNQRRTTDTKQSD